MINITNADLIQIFKEPSYEAQIDLASSKRRKVHSAALKELNKQVLDKERVSASPLKNCRQTTYGDCPFSQKVIEWKKENDITAGRNAAAIVFSSPNSKQLRHIISATEGPPGGAHAELQVVDIAFRASVQKEDIHILYTERGPCRCGSDCHRKLKHTLPNVEVVYSTPHTPHRKRQQENEERFQETQGKHGVRLAKRGKKLLFE